MNNHALIDLDQALAAADALPAATREALASEILARIGELAQSHLSDAQRAAVEARLGAPARYADADEVRAFFAKHGVEE